MCWQLNGQQRILLVTTFVLFCHLANGQSVELPDDAWAQPAVYWDGLIDEPVIPAAWSSAPLLDANRPLSDFRSDQFDGDSGFNLANSFNAFPEFEGGISIVNDKVAMKIGGYVKADLIKDFDAISSTDEFDTTSIFTDGSLSRNARFHARQSRLSFDTRWHVNERVVRAYIEGDFFSGDDNGTSNFRLRHAYGTLGRLTAGQTWTTFVDPSAVPPTLDFEGAVSNVNRRQGLVRYEQPIMDDRLTFAVAIEDPEFIFTQPEMVSGKDQTQSPDFLTRLRLEDDWGSFQVALVLRQLGFQVSDGPLIEELAWGFNFSGSARLLERTKGYCQITFGEGIGSYRGSPDAVATGPNTAAILPVFGWMVGVHHEWTDQLTSNVTFSKLTLEDQPGQSPANLADTTYLAVNLIANPYERVFCGIEYLYGIRQDVSGQSGSANRLQISFGFYLP